MTIEEVFKNRDILIAEKKNQLKRADVVLHVAKAQDRTEEADKAAPVIDGDPSVLTAKLVINTTNLVDSHMDCHIPGLWKKSLKETKQLFLLQEHVMDFKHIIADSAVDRLKAYTETLTFKELGFKYPGTTEALVFEAEIKKDVNEFMFDQYRKGRVNQHSVGMRYVKVFLCVNSEDAMYAAEKQNWDKYYPLVANPELPDKKGWFWAVTEAIVVEGSAVVKGSNHATPTQTVTADKDNAADNVTADKEEEPSNATPRRKSIHLLT